jgi:hypothetical protein
VLNGALAPWLEASAPPDPASFKALHQRFKMLLGEASEYAATSHREQHHTPGSQQREHVVLESAMMVAAHKLLAEVGACCWLVAGGRRGGGWGWGRWLMSQHGWRGAG